MLLAAAVALAIAGIVLVRVGWGGLRHVAVGGWAAVVVAILALAVGEGAWGIAVGVTVAMLVALGLLARDGVRTAPTRNPPARTPASVTLPHRALGVGRRLAVFLLVVPVGVAASYVFAMGAEAAAMRLGWHPADRTALAFIAAPVAWTLLASIQLMQAGPLRMILPPAVCAAAGGLLWWPL
ncbi:hypothetical protein ASE86_10480 [Sphingomonas sp. Leaf33]|uniref:hypothetical protein n=1 Tax=Sphingomonas sp. Leaf33 TaxID=1736215 RepID=UPI0006FB4797|nr:hypothetical protein [Sphingomonas sp. Leaf33]KQN26515.1 hypothetical protein ASE86_10480 [Sphingomonas sp. Leaf33]